jgi:hypothetical protein
MSKKNDKQDTQEVNLAEEVKGLFEGAEVTPEFEEKVSTILEAVVSSRVQEAEASLKEDYETKLAEAVEANASEVEDTINKYLDYVVTEWMEENKLAVESGIKTEITEGFIQGLKDLFETHYVEVPEGKEDLLAKAEAKAEDLEGKLHESIDTIATLKAQVQDNERANVMREQSEGLTDTQKEKLASLVEGVEYVDTETFTKKVTTIRESFFKDSKETKETKKDLNEEAQGDNKGNDKMSRYLKALRS